MKRTFILLAMLGCFSFLGMKVLNKSQTERCNSWMFEAAAAIDAGYYATGIEALTRYFAVPKCRSKQDVRAVGLLASSRLHVPLPENAELAQQVMLSRLGLQLGRSDAAKVSMASAHLARGEWEKALVALEDTRGRQALLIRLTSFVALDDTESAFQLISSQVAQDLGAFDLAILQELFGARGQRCGDGHALHISKDIKRFARFVVSPNEWPLGEVDIRKVAAGLDDDSLAFASSLLASKGAEKAAIALLDQPARSLKRQLLVRLADLYWRQEDMEKLDGSFLRRRVDGAMPAKAQLYFCLAQLKQSQQCTVNFNHSDQRARYGAFAADSWAGLFRELEAPDVNASKVLDHLYDMRSLLRGNGLVAAFNSYLYDQIGEGDLAQRFAKQAASINYDAVFADELHKSAAEWPCAPGDEGCALETLRDNATDLKLWRLAVGKGYEPTLAQAQQLEQMSPEQASFWRLVRANALIDEGSDQSMAEVILALRPIEQWASKNTRANLMSAVAYAHFKDIDAAFVRLAAVVKSAPEETVKVLRLVVGFYERDLINHGQLLHWWRALTLLELKARGVPSDGGLLTERLSLIAAYGEEQADRPLLLAVYEELLRLDGENHVALNNMAYHLAIGEERLEAALGMAEKARRLSPEQQAYQDTLEKVQEAIEASSDV